jgi:hypothetical protein
MANPIVLVFIHGWSVTSKNTYGDIAEGIQQTAAANDVLINSKHIYLGRYISFHDEVTLDDIVRALDFSLNSDLAGVSEFSCITHSTGGPIVRRWIDMFYGPSNLDKCPLRHLIMLAPANHGSALAIIGKKRIGRIKAWFEGVEPGQGVLDWLCLGSLEGWELQDRFTDYTLNGTQVFPFVLCGETIDTSFYDFLNSYLVENGSDGVVRLAGANLNYSFVRIEQTKARYDDKDGTYVLRIVPRQKKRPPRTPFGVIPKASHSGETFGIMRSVTRQNAPQKTVVAEIVRCLQVRSWDDYNARIVELDVLTTATQSENSVQYNGLLRRFVMFIFRVRDNEDHVISDYDLILLGDDFDPNKLPQGFYVDHQKNPKTHSLTYYMDYDILVRANSLGIRINARPSFGRPGANPETFSGYTQSEFRFTGRQLSELVRPNETVYVDVVLRRHVDREVLRLDPLSNGKGSFKRTRPQGGIN